MEARTVFHLGWCFGLETPRERELMVDKDDRKAILLRLYNEIDPVIKNHITENAKKEKDEGLTQGSTPEPKKLEEPSVEEHEATGDSSIGDIDTAEAEQTERHNRLYGVC